MHLRRNGGAAKLHHALQCSALLPPFVAANAFTA